MTASAARTAATAAPVEVPSRSARDAWPLAASIATLWVLTAIEVLLALSRNRGQFIYGLDDAYIHMTIARNLATHGVWGLTPKHFAPASSGPLWTILIAGCYLVFGVNQYTPLILNLIVATAFLGWAHVMLTRAGLTPPAIFATLIAIVILTPLPGLIVTGQEHVLHAMLTVIFLDHAGERLCKTATPRRSTVLLLALAPLVGFVRYEGLFLIGTAAALFLMAGEIGLGLALAAAGAAPALAMGAISVAKGGYFLPSSVLIKSGSANGIARFLNNWESNVHSGPHIVALAILAAGAMLIALISLPRKKWTTNPTIAKTLLLLAILTAHLIFALIHFFRYDAYLVSASIYVLALNWVAPWSSRLRSRVWRAPSMRLVGGVCISLTALMLILRGAWIFVRTPTACHNIYSQQYQMAQVIKRCYTGQPVALNDVGLVNYTADIRLLDLAGLANVEVARAILKRNLGPAEISRLASNAGTKIAVLFPNWFDGTVNGPLPSSWTKVASWTVPNHWMLGGNTVVFYAVDPAEAPGLSACLEGYRPNLPPEVAVANMWSSPAEASRVTRSP
jgi:hypothetical protein